jgi:hypothetical protein
MFEHGGNGTFLPSPPLPPSPSLPRSFALLSTYLHKGMSIRDLQQAVVWYQKAEQNKGLTPKMLSDMYFSMGVIYMGEGLLCMCPFSLSIFSPSSFSSPLFSPLMFFRKALTYFQLVLFYECNLYGIETIM